MKYPVTEGKTYKIVGATDGTVTDASGNVIISYTAGEEVTFDAPAGDYVNINPSGNILSNYATISYVDEAVNGIDLSDYATTAQLSNYATTAQLSNYATITYVDEAIAAGGGGGGGGGSFDMAAYNAFYGKYYNCTTVNEVSTINSDYKNDLTYKGGWIYDLGKLTNGSDMFVQCTNLNSFSSDLLALTNGYRMFWSCSNLTSFSGDLPNMTNGQYMFATCSKLTSFSGDLSALSDGLQMFGGCSKLTSFSGALPALTQGASMFGAGAWNCSKLDLASVQNIAETINDLTDKTSDGSSNWGKITIGISSSIQGNADLATALAAIEAKGWTVTVYYRA